MQSVIPIDAEAALAEDLSAYWGHPVYPTPLPDDYQSSLPCALVSLVGGGNSTMVTYEHDVSIDVYAPTFGAAITEANILAGIFSDLQHRITAAGRQWLTSEVNSLPYANPDPNNYKVPRASFAAIASIRGTIANI